MISALSKKVGPWWIQLYISQEKKILLSCYTFYTSVWKSLEFLQKTDLTWFLRVSFSQKHFSCFFLSSTSKIQVYCLLHKYWHWSCSCLFKTMVVLNLFFRLWTQMGNHTHMVHLSSLGELLETAHGNEPAHWPIHLFKVTDNNVVFRTRTPTSAGRNQHEFHMRKDNLFLIRSRIIRKMLFALTDV